ncbi:ParB/Srx family N-terminal domain-containing protein [Blastococcus sp. HT6-30]|uniref:ParB/Srx family N-terminal domain-containing protein n=1 Tax=Blastococcus sp. HT6-30 TaxID=3144843 RepID=UPI003218EAC1
MQPVFDELPIDDLRFDADNPRMPTHLDGKDVTAVLSFMLEDAGLLDLMRSISSQGFFPGEPLLVSSATEDTYTVVEGNRRLAASILLNNPDLAPTRKTAVKAVAESGQVPGTLPVLIFPERADILKHLGYRHVTGIKEWDPLAKARFLRQRYEGETGSPQDRFKALARSIGSRSDYVARLLTALALYNRTQDNEYYGIRELGEDDVDFSLFPSALAYSNIVEFLGLSSSRDIELNGLVDDSLRSLARWIFEEGPSGRTILGESRNIRILSEVVASPRALAALKGGATLDEASRMGGAASEAFRAAVGISRENLELAAEYLRDADDLTEADVESVDRVRRLSLEVRNAVRTVVEGDE